MDTRIDRIPAHDGGFDADIWLPEAGRGPGILLIQEIWGVGPFITKVAEDLASLGYVVAAPDLFWRLQRHFQAPHDNEGLKEAMRMAQRFDFAEGLADCACTLSNLRAMPEVSGGVGVAGFCMGGSLAYKLAASASVDAVLSFYGSAVPDAKSLMNNIDAPTLLVFGGKDPHLPRERVAAVEAAARSHPNIEVYVDERAGHAFLNHEAPDFYHPEAAADAWRVSLDFLRAHLPVRP
jgi:carboxymethylenebutenolidase